MKLVLFVGVVGLVGFGLEARVVPPSGRVLEDVASWFIGCVNKSLVDGLPAIGVPSRNPLRLNNLSVPLTLGQARSQNTFYNIVWNNLPLFDIEQLTGTRGGSNDTGFWAHFDWRLHWDRFLITSDFDWSVTGPNITTAENGTSSLRLTLRNVHWFGTWNSTIADNDHPSLGGTPFDTEYEQAIQNMVDPLFNNVPAGVAQFLRDNRFNGFWNDPNHPERVQAIIDHCNA